MKIIILKEKLKEGVKIVEKISQKSSTLPVLQNTFLEAKKNILKLTTTNLESSISWFGLAKITGEGGVCIPTRFLSNLLGFLPNKPLLLDVKKFILNLESGDYSTKVKGLNPEDFPIIPQIEKTKPITVNSFEFCRSLEQLLNIPSSSTARPEISGILFSFQKKLIKIVATDSFRLAEKKLFIKKDVSKECSLILPQSAAKEIVGVFGEKKGNLNIYLSPNQLLIEDSSEGPIQPSIQFSSRLIKGEYPNYEEIIPKKYETTIQVSKKEFLNQVKTASLFSGKINEVKIVINVKNKQVEISSQSPDLGEYKSSLGGIIKGKNTSVSFNHRFLIDGISEIKGDEILFSFTDKEGPAVLKPLNAEDFLYIIMPIKAN